jgi:asparagine synthase (glutamine-hydrolysing)
MCGIAGFAGRGDRSDLAAMTAVLAHRGPDGDGQFVDEQARTYLGHRRLAIIDIAGGHQPMWNEDGQVGIVFNGEIYNHRELRAELQRCGHVFASDHSDTEVLVHGYEEWGCELLGRLNGMFAFAILDRRRQRLVLARDRFGEKPLFYYDQPGLFAFASELTALASHREVSRSINPRSVQKLFAYGYLPGANAFFTGSKKLPEGHYLTHDLATRETVVTRYYQFRIEPDESLTDAHEPALVEELRNLLQTAVARRMVSDVPLGIFLSGGLDSSMCLAMAAKSIAPSALQTFTIGFREASFDESGFAHEVAASFGTNHRMRRLTLDHVGDLIQQVLSLMDEPLGDPSLLPAYVLSRFAREHVTVALTGDGGDELFAGYDPFKALTPARLYSRLMPSGLHRGLRSLAELIPFSARNMSLDFKVRRALSGLSYPPSVWNPVWMSALEPRDIAELMQEPLSLEELYEEAIDVWDGNDKRDLVDRTLEFFTRLYLPGDILVKSDRAAMLNSLETRAVFLDNDLVDFCSRLPNRFKFRGGQRKVLLRKAMDGLVPPAILERPKKGFGIPLMKWLKDIGPSIPMVPVPGTRPGSAERFRSEHLSGQRERRLFLWTWLALQKSAVAPVTSTRPIAA